MNKTEPPQILSQELLVNLPRNELIVTPTLYSNGQTTVAVIYEEIAHQRFYKLAQGKAKVSSLSSLFIA